LLVTRIEPVLTPGSVIPYDAFVLRNIGHGPALFVEVQAFTLGVGAKGDWRIEVGPVDLVESGKIAPLLLTPRGEGQTPPGHSELVSSLSEKTGRAMGDCDVVIFYEDVEKRRFTSVMKMGKGGTKLVRHQAI
jgi:hypothetical protein